MYQVKIKGKNYELPKKTISVMNKLEEFSTIEARLSKQELNIEQAVFEQYNFVCECLGQDNADEYFGSDDIQEIDTDEILFLSLEIVRAYTANATKLKNEQIIGQYKTVLNDPNVKKIIEVVGKI